ncbi:hypothetical protein GGTG_13401 [Gaeumannomyces tritici R3-111a-1]|uniref:NACHT domain-containing protein n=1 Tax=Gaeumannomyces tritici (strain R3-111a-1) TaxID=644352 RepID=J3PIS2_GAET3|nr:hypothetical protein GGTG_13401 [Gaeumannomyces tritici R3-111a-1]EJT69004.1 hypothetical protein GGTG_13401 [Gaeumannomyces tritici R3-111a-1]
MEPVTIVGLVSGIITFIDFGIKVAQAATLARQAAHVVIPELSELEHILDDIQRHNNQVSNDPSVSEQWKNLRPLVSESEKLHEELRAILLKLKMPEGTRFKSLEAARIMLTAQLKKGDIDKLRGRLESLDSRIRRNVSTMLQVDQQSAVVKELKSLREMHQNYNINTEFKLDQIRQDIHVMATNKEVELAALKERLECLDAERKVSKQQTEVLESLFFQDLHRRFYRIPESDKYTSEWLFNRGKTSFGDWLEFGRGIFWITGKAGSGKSTLMKFASQHASTQSPLRRWAGPAKLCTASYYFWNQGFNLQKSRVGLLRTLIFEILRSSPSIIPQVAKGRSRFDSWERAELESTLRLIAEQDQLPMRFCFFIDGLDEYDGMEEDVVEVLTFLAATAHIKLCVSTRPRSVFDRVFNLPANALVLHNYTMDGIRSHISKTLLENDMFDKLEPESREGIIKKIAQQAQGVWLWVYLVIRDIRLAVNRNEPVEKLEQIVSNLPVDLEAYFERSIQRIHPSFRREMAETFLITIEEVQPLPLFAFELLETERRDPDYAIRAPVEPLNSGTIRSSRVIWADRVQNRCGDLLDVSDGAHPTFLWHPVDFLHRTVRDFLRDSYSDQLKRELGSASDFDAPLSLCKVMLRLLKGLPKGRFSEEESFNRVVRLVDELLYYAHEVEKRSGGNDGGSSNSYPKSTMVALLDEVDRVNSRYAKYARVSSHWTNVRDLPRSRFLSWDEYHERGRCDFIALAIQARLTRYVGAKLTSSPDEGRTLMGRKQGRPYLGYALRPLRVTPVKMPYHSVRDDAPVDVVMVALLLSPPLSADPNQQVYVNDGRTVWALFLVSCLQMNRRGEAAGSEAVKEAWLGACKLLIRHGAREDCFRVGNWDNFDESRPRSVHEVFGELFGAEQAGVLSRMMEEEAQARRGTGWFSSWGPFGWAAQGLAWKAA